MSVETIAFRMIMTPGKAEEYKRRHGEIWPDLSDELIKRGVIDYRIFLDPGTNHLFAVMTRRTDHELNTLPQTDVMKRWWAMMGDIMATNPDASPQQVGLDEMFALTAPDTHRKA